MHARAVLDQDALPGGIYTLEPFARYLETTFKANGLSNRFTGLTKELYIPAIDLETGESVLFGDEGWREVPISRAVAASSAAPIYFCPVRIEDRDYIDAGIGRLTFFDIAVSKRARRGRAIRARPQAACGLRPSYRSSTSRSATARKCGLRTADRSTKSTRRPSRSSSPNNSPK